MSEHGAIGGSTPESIANWQKWIFPQWERGKRTHTHAPGIVVSKQVKASAHSRCVLLWIAANALFLSAVLQHDTLEPPRRALRNLHFEDYRNCHGLSHRFPTALLTGEFFSPGAPRRPSFVTCVAPLSHPGPPRRRAAPPPLIAYSYDQFFTGRNIFQT